MMERMKLALRTRVAMGWAAAAVLATGVAGTAFGAATLGAAPGAANKAAIEKIVRDYIMAHPEIIPEAINGMQAREVSKLLASNRKEIETPFPGTVAGNPNGDVTVVEFFDYACPFCRQAHADMAKLAKADPGVRLVYRDFPVIAPASDEAAMASLSAAAQGRYQRFHDAMFDGQEKVSHERVVSVVRSSGLNELRTAKDLTAAPLRAEIKKNIELGRALNLSGTPSYIIGDRILSGAVGFDALKAAVDEARAAKKA